MIYHIFKSHLYLEISPISGNPIYGDIVGDLKKRDDLPNLGKLLLI